MTLFKEKNMSELNARTKAVFAIADLTSSLAPVREGGQESPLDTFGANVFDDKAMRRYLPRAVYRSLRKTMDCGEQLDPGGHGTGSHALYTCVLSFDRVDG